MGQWIRGYDCRGYGRDAADGFAGATAGDMQAMPPEAMGGMGPMHMEAMPPDAMGGMGPMAMDGDDATTCNGRYGCTDDAGNAT